MDGIVLINKPKGITSYDVIRKAKKIFNTSKIGHTGTLDPFAEGLLILCIGKATKLSNMLTNGDKHYDGIISFGKHYDTYDITGEVISESDLIPSFLEVSSMASKMIGKYDQIPPIYSAIKVDGKKLYEYARKNQEVEIKTRPVEIFDFKIEDLKIINEFKFEAHVSKGTYIRSLAVDLASNLNTLATLKTLRRTKIVDFNLEDAVELDNLSTSDIVSIKDIFKNNEKIIVSEYLGKLVKNGIVLDERQIITTKDFLVYNELNELLAVYEVVEENIYKPLIIF